MVGQLSNWEGIHEFITTIKEHHIDSLGHVNNASYLQLLEEARWEWSTERGVGLDYIKKHQVGIILLEMKVRFRRELLNRQKIKILTQWKGVLSKVQALVEQNIYILPASGEEEIHSCQAEFFVAMIDLEKRKLIPWDMAAAHYGE